MSALTFVAAQLLRALPRARVSHTVGRLAEHRWSEPVGRIAVGLYASAYGVNLAECHDQPWESFDAFFTRPLRPGARPIVSPPNVLVSPADGRLDALEHIDSTLSLSIKGNTYSVGELLDHQDEARRFEGGAAAVVYLSPRDYHRVHAPVSGTLHTIRSLPGDYFPVNAIGIRHVPKLLARNRRVAFSIDTERGRVTVVMVAAIVVGRITAAGIDAPDVPLGEHSMGCPIARGDELGVFHLGSTAVLLIEAPVFEAWLEEGPAIQMGMPLARVRPTRTS
ncbi:MAG: archaetidylserine decarboxylase [Myxococcales bacterium]